MLSNHFITNSPISIGCAGEKILKIGQHLATDDIDKSLRLILGATLNGLLKFQMD